MGGVYTMENKNTGIDYQNVRRVGNQKWEIIEISIGIIFLFEIPSHYFLYREFLYREVPPEKKSTPTKEPVPTQSRNLT